MRIVPSAGAVFLWSSMAILAQDKLAAPDWLAPYPGVREEIVDNKKTSRVTHYSAPATPAEIKAYYERKAVEAGLKLVATFDGIGETLRVTSPTRSAVIRIRAADGGSAVDVHLIGSDPPPAPPAPKAQPAATLAPGFRFAWPAWVTPPPGHRFSTGPSPVPESQLRHGLGRLYQPCLSATFQTQMTVEDVHKFYDQSLTRSGHPPARKRLVPGNATLNGKMIGAVQGTIEFFDDTARPPTQGEIVIGWTDLNKPRIGSIWVCVDR